MEYSHDLTPLPQAPRARQRLERIAGVPQVGPVTVGSDLNRVSSSQLVALSPDAVQLLNVETGSEPSSSSDGTLLKAALIPGLAVVDLLNVVSHPSMGNESQLAARCGCRRLGLWLFGRRAVARPPLRSLSLPARRSESTQALARAARCISQ